MTIKRLGLGFAGVLAMLMAASACSALGEQGGTSDPDGCNPQVPATYRIQSTLPAGLLEIRVRDASGNPVASANIQVTRMVYTGLRCPSTMEATTDATGLVRLERMKTGPYLLSLQDSEATASAEVKANETASVTLSKS